MTDATIVYLVLAGVVALFVWNRIPVEIVAVGASLTLLATGVISVQQSFAGFGDTTVIFIAALFIVSEGIDSTGVTTAAGQWMVAKAGNSQSRLIVLMMVMVAVLTAVISVNGAVAALLPMVVVVAVQAALGWHMESPGTQTSVGEQSSARAQPSKVRSPAHEGDPPLQ